MMFHTLYDGKVSAYKEQFECELVGADIEIFTKSWEQIVKRHSILRTAFYNDKFNIPVQCVYKEVALPMELLDYSAMPADEMNSALKEYKKTERERALDFKSAPLSRIAMIRLPNDRYKMIWTYHHIISDGWSMAVLMEEFLNTYELLSEGQSIEIKQADNYEDYIRYIESVDKNQEQAYWKNYLKNIESGTLLPFIDKTSELTKGAGTYDSVYIKLDIEKARQVQNFVRDSHLTLNTLMQGVWSYLLHAYTGNDDVVYGVIVSGRPDDLSGIEHRVGMYINTLPLHTHFNSESEIKKWLTDLQNEQVLSRQYQYSSLSAIKSWAHIPAEIFDSLLIFENYPVNKVLGEKKWKLQVDGVSVNEQTNYPLNIVIGSADEIIIRFSYNAKLLAKEYVQEISNHFENVLNQIVQNGGSTLAEINLITQLEKDQILLDFNNAKADYPKNKSVVELFEQQVSNTPGNIAAIFEEEKLTYDELNKRSNQVAGWLRNKGIKENTFVPICIDRSFEMITGILGILKAGAAYVPIDPEYPEERINYILEDTSARFIVTNVATAQKLSKNSNFSILELDTEADKISAQPDKNLNLNIEPDSLAYVIYTSGSTGKPKGVMIEHVGIINLALSQIDAFGLKPGMKSLQFASFGFDASTSEIFCTLLSGGVLIQCSKESLLSAEGFEKIVENHQVDIVTLPPSYQIMVKGMYGSIKTVVSAGEPLNESIAEYLLSQNIKLINAYGPTENTVCTTLTDNPFTYNTVSIGNPIANVQVYILNKFDSLCPIGVPGELYISGNQVSRGYLNLPKLTKEKFIKDPFSKEQNARMYRSGDLARWLPDGNIEYLGRMDDQVKIRGYRIELGEIESVLLQSDLISQAVVLAKGDGSGGKRLVGYVSSIDKEFDQEEIITWLRTKLPEYMVPGLWMKLENFPLTPSGKIDRKSLPEVSVNELIKSEYVAPRNSLEERLAKIWRELLNAEKIGVYDNFFELGGHSLMAMRLLTAIHKELGIEVLVIKDLFQFSTIDELSKYLEIKLDTDSQEQDLEEFEFISL
ncbi:MAG: amino acid adenylation domain-containing protein, partial [Ginsengibacter sp.]